MNQKSSENGLGRFWLQRKRFSACTWNWTRNQLFIPGNL